MHIFNKKICFYFCLCKSGDFAKSVELYSEAVKRNPEEPRNYTNRASSYIKLMALSEALKDAEMAIKVDPTFSEYYIWFTRTSVSIFLMHANKMLPAKGYVRKCGVYVAMKDYDKALQALEEVSGCFLIYANVLIYICIYVFCLIGSRKRR